MEASRGWSSSRCIRYSMNDPSQKPQRLRRQIAEFKAFVRSVAKFTVPEDGSAPQGDGLGAAVGAAVKSGKNETDHAAIRIQAKMRGKSTRNAHMARMNTQGFLVPTEEEAPPVVYV